MPDTPPNLHPLKMNLERTRGLTIVWSDGVESRYPLTYLRNKCPCATCRTPPPPAKGLSLNILPDNFESRATVANASLVGNYALQIYWADGHDTGIYDFEYLRSIDPGTSAAGA